MRSFIRILGGLAGIVFFGSLVGLLTYWQTGDVDKGLQFGLFTLALFPAAVFVVSIVWSWFLAGRAVVRGTVQVTQTAGTRAGRFLSRALYAITGIDTRKIAERWRERE
jgi:hypothetical protein